MPSDTPSQQNQPGSARPGWIASVVLAYIVSHQKETDTARMQAIADLKSRQVNELSRQLGQEPPYSLAFLDRPVESA